MPSRSRSHSAQVAASPKPTVASTRADLIAFIANTEPPQLHSALVADDREADRWAAYVGQLHSLVGIHIAVLLRGLSAQYQNGFDARDELHAVNTAVDDLVALIEHSANAEGE